MCNSKVMVLIKLIKESRGFIIMNMNDALKIAILLSIGAMIIKIIMNVIYHFGIDFVGLFEDLWKKIKGTK